MKYVEAMFEPNGGTPEECGDAEAQVGSSAHRRVLAAIKTAVLESNGKADEIDADALADDIVEIANEEINIDEHHAEFDPETSGSFRPFDRVELVERKLALIGVLPFDEVAILRLSDLKALIAERDELISARDDLRVLRSRI